MVGNSRVGKKKKKKKKPPKKKKKKKIKKKGKTFHSSGRGGGGGKFPQHLIFFAVFKNFNALIDFSRNSLTMFWGKPTVLSKVGWKTLTQTLSASLNKLQNKIKQSLTKSNFSSMTPRRYCMSIQSVSPYRI